MINEIVYLYILLFIQLEKCAQDLGSTSKAVGSSMAQLLTCAAQGNEHYTGKRSVFCSESGSGLNNLLLCRVVTLPESIDIINIWLAGYNFV